MKHIGPGKILKLSERLLKKDKKEGNSHLWTDEVMYTHSLLNPGQKIDPPRLQSSFQSRGQVSQIFCSCFLKRSGKYIKMSTTQMRLLNSFLRTDRKEKWFTGACCWVCFYFGFCSSNPQAHSSPSSWILICFVSYECEHPSSQQKW